jgi:integrase/recombinase XerD
VTQLRDRMIEDMKLHGLAPRTQEAYVSAVRQLAKYWRKSPDRISEEELRKYFLWMVEEQKAARSTCTIAITGIKFFFEKTLHRQWPTLALLRPRAERKLPEVLSVEEVGAILGCVRKECYRVCLGVIYACGLRLLEGVRLHPGDIDGGRHVLRVRKGKGNKDRTAPIPDRMLEVLRGFWGSHHDPEWMFPALRRRRAGAAGPMSESGLQRAFRLALRESSERAHLAAFLRDLFAGSGHGLAGDPGVSGAYLAGDDGEVCAPDAADGKPGDGNGIGCA